MLPDETKNDLCFGGILVGNGEIRLEQSTFFSDINDECSKL